MKKFHARQSNKMKLSTKEQNDKRQQLGRMSILAPPPPHPGANALEIRGARANGLLSPALSSKGGEGEDSVTTAEDAPLLMFMIPRGPGGRAWSSDHASPVRNRRGTGGG